MFFVTKEVSQRFHGVEHRSFNISQSLSLSVSQSLNLSVTPSDSADICIPEKH